MSSLVGQYSLLFRCGGTWEADDGREFSVHNLTIRTVHPGTNHTDVIAERRILRRSSASIDWPVNTQYETCNNVRPSQRQHELQMITQHAYRQMLMMWPHCLLSMIMIDDQLDTSQRACAKTGLDSTQMPPASSSVRCTSYSRIGWPESACVRPLASCPAASAWNVAPAVAALLHKVARHRGARGQCMSSATANNFLQHSVGWQSFEI